MLDRRRTAEQGGVTLGGPRPGDRRIGVDKDHRVPQSVALGPLQEGAVDEHHSVDGHGDWLVIDRLIALQVVDPGPDAAVAAGTERPQHLLSPGSEVVRVRVVARRRGAALPVPPGQGVMEVVRGQCSTEWPRAWRRPASSSANMVLPAAVMPSTRPGVVGLPGDRRPASSRPAREPRLGYQATPTADTSAGSRGQSDRQRLKDAER